MENNIRNIRKLRKNKTVKYHLSFVFLAAVMILSVFFTVKSVYAKNSNDNKVKLYKSIMVYSGDTLETIAEKYTSDEQVSTSAYIKEVANINNITTETVLVPGNHIIVPYYAERKMPEIEISVASNDEIINEDSSAADATEELLITISVERCEK